MTWNRVYLVTDMIPGVRWFKSNFCVFQVRQKRSKCVEQQWQQQAAVEGIWIMLWNVCRSRRRTHDTTGLPHPPSLMLRDYLFLRCQIPFLLPSSRHPWSYQTHGKLFLSIACTYKQKKIKQQRHNTLFLFLFCTLIWNIYFDVIHYILLLLLFF